MTSSLNHPHVLRADDFQSNKRAFIPKVRESSFLIVAILASSSFCLYFAKYDLEFINPYRFADLGRQLYSYELTLQGQLPYVDFWTNWWGPASYYLNAIAFKVMGVSIYSANVLLAIFTAISAIAVYCISARVVPKPLAFAIAMVSLLWGNFTLNFPYCGAYANCFGLLALLAFIKHLESEKRKYLWLIAAGLALGLDFSSKQHIGVLNTAAVAVATALSCHVVNGLPERTEGGETERAGRFRYPLILLNLMLLVPGSVVFPFLILKEQHGSGVRLDAKMLFLFFLPVFVVNAVAFALSSQTFSRSGKEFSLRARFLDQVKRDGALGAGFVLAVAPWFIYFSHIIGWRDFWRMILLIHPVQENFKRAYVAIMPRVEFPLRSMVFHLFFFLVCSAVISLFVVSKSRSALRVSAAASVVILILCAVVIFPVS
ncbi:MAG: glycosyltransferase family 39 protein, partial [Candidatus Lindowbacteria bacterium]|nr:glycosyltransferase family 39 protein [Candidatus Lindowbacteria bacterium]